jgi:putative endonuclease
MWVYILFSEKVKKYYIGQTRNIVLRLMRHNQGKSKSTKYGIPWKLVYREECCSRTEAVRREKLIKSYKGGIAFKKLLGQAI